MPWLVQLPCPALCNFPLPALCNLPWSALNTYTLYPVPRLVRRGPWGRRWIASRCSDGALLAARACVHTCFRSAPIRALHVVPCVDLRRANGRGSQENTRPGLALRAAERAGKENNGGGGDDIKRRCCIFSRSAGQACL